VVWRLTVADVALTPVEQQTHKRWREHSCGNYASHALRKRRARKRKPTGWGVRRQVKSEDPGP
jgi:hypothetical protein